MKKYLLVCFSLMLAFAVSAQDKAKTTNTSKTAKPLPVQAAPAAHDHSHDGHDHSHDGHNHAPAAPAANNPNAPVIKFTEEMFDFGELPEGPQATHEFKFKNTGKEPLILSKVQASCGCTTPSWPKEPIMPGKEGTIVVTYNTQGRPGPFTKSVTINSNASEATKVINIKGDVIKEDPAKFTPVQQPNLLAPKN